MSRRRDSENEDDPEPYQSSGEEWDVEKAKMEESGRRKSTRLSKKPRRTVVEESASDSDLSVSSDEDKRRKKNKKGGSPIKKTKASPIKNDSKEEKETTEDEDTVKKEKESVANSSNTDSDSSKTNSVTISSNVQSRGIHRKFIPKTIFSEDYATGSFVILKKDAQVGDPSKHPCIWRIDGKALLQKYEAFDEDGKVRHKNTSIYTGWSPLDKDLYAPITVDVVRHNNNNLTVELHWDKLKVINMDSD